jgi:23S rRNA (pseudouridine1915-N3)-methyltransferase
LNLHIFAHGRAGRCPEAELVDRYLKRIAWPVRLSEIGGPPPPPAALPARTIVLDERGTTLSSADFAARIGRFRDDGVRELRFLIGPADGHPPAVRDGADLLLAFGPATWPHLLVRAMLAEQLYRAFTILSGHPYHRQ